MSGKAFKLYGVQHVHGKRCVKQVVLPCQAVKGATHRTICNAVKGHEGDCYSTLSCALLHRGRVMVEATR